MRALQVSRAGAASPCGAAADATAVRGAARSGAGLDVTLRSCPSFRCPEPKGLEWLGLELWWLLFSLCLAEHRKDALQ